MKRDLKELIDKITHTLNRLRDEYYNGDAPTTSDYEYDMLLKKLEKLEKESGYRSPDSPTQEVGVTLHDTKFSKVKHSVPMLSLENTFDTIGIREFISRAKDFSDSDKELELVVELKLDGMSLSLEYDNGQLQRAVTRGDGSVGEDVTENAVRIKGVPLSIPYKERLFVRGEVLMSFKEFRRVNAERLDNGLDTYANPRNLAAGTMRSKHSSALDDRKLTFKAYELAGYKESLSQIKVREVLKKLLFDVVDGMVITSTTELKPVIDNIKDNIIDTYDFPVDGLVFKVTDRDLINHLGSTNKYPKWAVAYKFPAMRVTTRLNDVTYQVGRMGRITPVAHVDPVLLAGTTVSKATLHNFSEIARKDIRIGDKVFIEKAGEIIPQIIKPIKSVRTGKEIVIEIPKVCPVCGSNSVYVSDDLTEVKCVNPNCSGINTRRIEHFVSRDAMDISGLGEQTIKSLLDAGLIKTYSDIYKIYHNGNINKIASLPGFGDKSVVKLKASIAKSKTKEFWHVLYSLGINNVGRHVSKLLQAKFKNIDNIINASIDDIQSINGIGSTVAYSLSEFLNKKENIELIAELKSYGLHFEDTEDNVTKNSSSALDGKRFVVTGVFDGYSRKQIQEMITTNGGKVSSSVSKNTTAVIAGDKPGKSKIHKAKENSIPIQSLEYLMNLIK